MRITIFAKMRDGQFHTHIPGVYESRELALNACERMSRRGYVSFELWTLTETVSSQVSLVSARPA